MDEVAVERVAEDAEARDEDGAGRVEDLEPPDTGHYVTYPGEGR